MKTKTYHVSNFGRFAPMGYAESDGYVTYHDSPRYERAKRVQLNDWLESRSRVVRAAAATELAERAVTEWRRSN